MKTKILIVDDEKLIGWSLQQKMIKKGYEVYTTLSAEEGLEVFKKESPDIVFLDNKLPNMQGLELLQQLKRIRKETIVIFMTAFGSVETAVKAMKLGAHEYINKPFNFEEIEILLRNIDNMMELENELQVLRQEHRDKIDYNSIIGTSNQIKKLIDISKKICTSQASTVLLLGKSGTGKDLLARAIHNESKRSGKPFVTINCSSLPETLLESELFGHEQGAFTDAHKQKKGLFEIADGGTVFLDEIGEISMAVQIKLLNIIEYKSFKRLGGLKDINVDIRIIAATNKNLEDSIKVNKFRYDLYYRLKVFQITIPPLKERREDIPLLTEHFIKYFNKRFNREIKGISDAAQEALMHYEWPGNIRELRNVIERAIILETGSIIQIEHLSGELRANDVPVPVSSVNNWFEIPDEGFSLDQIEKTIIQQTLIRVNNNQTRAAKLMGISRDKLRYKIKKHEL